MVWVVSSEQEGKAEIEVMIANLNKDETYLVTVQTLNESVCGNKKSLELSTGSFCKLKQKKNTNIFLLRISLRLLCMY